MKEKLLISLYIVAAMLPQNLGKNISDVVTSQDAWQFTDTNMSENTVEKSTPISVTTSLNTQVGQTSKDLPTDVTVTKIQSTDAYSITPEVKIRNTTILKNIVESHKTEVENNGSDIKATTSHLYYDQPNFQTNTTNAFSNSPKKNNEAEVSTTQKESTTVKNVFENMSSSKDSMKYEFYNEGNSSNIDGNSSVKTEDDGMLDSVPEWLKSTDEATTSDAESSYENSGIFKLYYSKNDIPKEEITENYNSLLATEVSDYPKRLKKPGSEFVKLTDPSQIYTVTSLKAEPNFKEVPGFFTIFSETKTPSSSEVYRDKSSNYDSVDTTTEQAEITPVYKSTNKTSGAMENEDKYLRNKANTTEEESNNEEEDVSIEFDEDSESKLDNTEIVESVKEITIAGVKKTIGIMVDDVQDKTKEPTFDLSNNKTNIFKSSVKVVAVSPTTDATRIVYETESNISTEFSNTNSKIIPSGEDIDLMLVDAEPTRVPKKIQNEYEIAHESRSRPARPDPGYHSYNQEFDYNRPYRPDSPSYERPYFRPTPDYRTPLIRQGPDYTRPSRPDQDTRRTSYRPEFGMAKYPLVESDHEQQTPQESSRSKPYRPLSSKPYRPQGSFSKPYHPDYHKPSGLDSQLAFGKPEYIGSSKPDTYGTNIYQLSTDNSERTRDDFEYTRQADANIDQTKSALDGIRTVSQISGIKQSSRPISMDSKRTPQTSQDSTGEETEQRTSRPAIIDTRSRPTSDSYHKTPEVQSQTMDTTKPSKVSNIGQMGGYPRPGFGANYGGKPEVTSTPFSPSSIMVSMRNLTRVEIIKADCFDNHMKVSVRFNGSFEGLIYSSGYSYDPTCNYINGSGRHQYDFFIRLNRCGTLGQHEVPDPSEINFARRRQERAQYLVNTVSVQYNPMIEEDTDEHFRVTCEYGYDFWKTVTFPVINIESSAVKVREGSPMVFTLPPPQCNMEIRSGYGPTGNRISGPVNVGDPVSLVIHMKSETPGFDILVSNCVAHNGAKKRLQLIDANGCVVQEKLVSAFRGVSSPDRSQQLTLYSYLKAFRFTGSPALYIECDVHMCHGSCPPQRCYWRHLYKRSIENVTTPSPEKDGNGVLSESVSLFQALEVRHDDVDLLNPISVLKNGPKVKDDAVCMRKSGFAAIFSSLLILVLVCSIMSMFLCSKIRKMKYVEAPPAHAFSELSYRLHR